MKYDIRTANSRTVMGLRNGNESCAQFAEDYLADSCCAALTGGGMDAPQTLPTGSIKAWFDPPEMQLCIGQCQRTTERASR